MQIYFMQFTELAIFKFLLNPLKCICTNRIHDKDIKIPRNCVRQSKILVGFKRQDFFRESRNQTVNDKNINTQSIQKQ